MRLLLDTHAFLWWLEGNPRLGERACALIGDPGTRVAVSAVSAWEIAVKLRKGSLVTDRADLGDIVDEIRAQDFDELPITVSHAERAGRLPGHHSDPFDRLLIAQAQAEGLTLVSNEELFDRYGVTRAW
jgi:PIN domain nuclease of toxin-antitoxin system